MRLFAIRANFVNSFTVKEWSLAFEFAFKGGRKVSLENL